MTVHPKAVNVWMVGGGIANMAAAAFLIRDVGVPGENIHILETLNVEGGSLDGAVSPVRAGYVTRGGRMLEDEAFRCLWNLLESIPDRDDPSRSAREVIVSFNQRVKTESHARLINSDHEVVDATVYGFNTRDRMELTRLLALSERALGARRIDEMFSEHFFETNFWQMWRTTFAFQLWHSAIELRRYFIRFVQEFPHIHTLSGVRRTVYNQYDSIVVPLQKWLSENNVDVWFGTTATDADFVDDGGHRRATKLRYHRHGEEGEVELGQNDYLFMTLGSITADSTYADNHSVPELIRDRRDGSWAFWDTIAKKAPDFGRPNTFYGNIDENKWESFTLTMHNRTLLDRIIKFSNNDPGTGALMTWFNSSWLMSIVVPHQPHFPDMPRDTYTLWGYGLFIDDEGDYVRKKMSGATGEEILTELIHQLGFEDILDEVLDTTDVTTVMLPYASALFSRRAPEDRPKVVPDRAENFAFLGQFTDLPEDVVFTVEYSVHGAMHAVYRLFGVDKEIPPIYHGLLDPKVGLRALESAFK
ncbi:MAG: oleate hydratase [Acidimicrobiales bacterium]